MTVKTQLKILFKKCYSSKNHECFLSSKSPYWNDFWRILWYWNLKIVIISQYYFFFFYQINAALLRRRDLFYYIIIIQINEFNYIYIIFYIFICGVIMIIVIMTVCRRETQWERKGGWHGEKAMNQDSSCAQSTTVLNVSVLQVYWHWPNLYTKLKCINQ